MSISTEPISALSNSLFPYSVSVYIQLLILIDSIKYDLNGNNCIVNFSSRAELMELYYEMRVSNLSIVTYLHCIK